MVAEVRKEKLAREDEKANDNEEERGREDSPKESVEEEQREVHNEHDGEGEGGLVGAERVPEVLVRASLNLHSRHDSDGILEREREEEVRLDELASEDEAPEEDRSGSGSSCERKNERGEGGREERRDQRSVSFTRKFRMDRFRGASREKI